MTALKVTLVIDECDATLTQVTEGYVQIAPSARLPDPADQAIVGQAPVRASFSGDSPPQVDLVGTDQVGPQSDGWTYSVTYYQVPGVPFGYSWSFYLRYADGATQHLSALAQVPAAQPGAQYVPLPGTPPQSPSQVLGLSSDSPLVTEWVGQSAGTGTVTSVNDINPDGSGNVTLAAADVGAASTGALSSEATARANADTALSAAVGTETTRAQTAEGLRVQVGNDIGGTPSSPAVISVLGGKIPLASTSYIDLCAAWNNGSPVAAVTPSVPLTVTFTGSSTTATVTSGTAPASGAIISDALPSGTTYTASGSALTLSNAATGTSGSYPAWAGQDITAALQAAFNYFNSRNIDGTITFGTPGVYLVAGVQQSGTSHGIAYSGSVVLPARPIDSATPMLAVRVKGSQGVAGFPGFAIPDPLGGVILLSSPPSGGAVFDALAGGGAGSPAAGIVVTFEDITIRCRTNPQGTAVNASGFAGLVFRGSCTVDTILPSNGWPFLSGTGYAVQWPAKNNMAMLHQAGELAIAGYPNAILTGEHLLCDYLFVQYCGTAITSGNTPHLVKLGKVCIQSCTYGIAPGFNPTHLTGLFDIGDGTNLTAFFNDPNNQIYGDIQLAPTSYSNTAPTAELPGLGFPSNGGQNVVVRPLTRVAAQWPSDTFTRASSSGLPVTYTNGPGATDRTCHIWRSTTAVVFPSGGGMKASGSNPLSRIMYNTGRSNPSRVVRLGVTTAVSGYDILVFAGWVIAGSNVNNHLIVELKAGNLLIEKNVSGTATTLATASGVIAGSTAYTVDTYISNPYSAAGLLTVTVFLNGTQAATYTLTGTDAAQLSDTEQFFTQDGLQLFADTSSLITEFAVLPAT